MDSLEKKLLLACSRGNVDEVKYYLKKGANMNMITSTGRTPFGTAAQLGNTAILKAFLENCGKNQDQAQTEDKSNLGYFVFVHNDHDKNEINDNLSNHFYDFEDDEELCQLEAFDDCHLYMSGTTFNLASFNDPFIRRDPRFEANDWINEIDLMFDEDAITPDGMDNLEWDMEVEGNKDVMDDDDPWSALYMWYAGILSQTSSLLEEKPPPNDIDREDQFGRRALHYAAVEGHIDSMRLLINAGCKVNVRDLDNYTPLHMAASKEVPEIIELLIKSGANIHHKSTDKISPLHVSASRGLLQNVKLLIAAGAHVNTADSSDRTPLFMAVSRGHNEVVQYLIEQGAKINMEEIHGYTPLCEAVWQKNTTIVKMLLDAGAKITQSHHLLHYAVLHRHEDMVRLLISAGSIINLRDDSGDTPLIVAAKTQQSHIARLLLENGAFVNCASTVTGHTALHEAVENIRGGIHPFREMFSVLQEYDVNLEAESESGYTPLNLAINKKQDEAAAILIRHGADVNHPEAAHYLGMLFCCLVRDNRFLCELFVYAGYDIHKLQLSYRTPSVTSKWILELQTSPMRLCDLCRIKLRRHFKSKVYEKVSVLPLPSVVKTFLKLEDISDE